MAVDLRGTRQDQRWDDQIVRDEMRPIQDPDPTKFRVLPVDTGQAESVNDFLPPAPDTFDINMLDVKKDKQPPAEDLAELEAKAAAAVAAAVKPKGARRSTRAGLLHLSVFSKRDSTR